MYVVECKAQRVSNTTEKRGKLQNEPRSKDKCANLSFSILRRSIQDRSKNRKLSFSSFRRVRTDSWRASLAMDPKSWSLLQQKHAWFSTLEAWEIL